MQVENDLRDSPASFFPCLDSKPGSSGEWQSAEVPFRDVVGLHTFCTEHKVSPLAIFQTAWALVLRCYLANSSVCFACSLIDEMNVVERIAEIEDFYQNTSNCCAELEDSMLILDLLRAMHINCINSQPNSSKPFIPTDTELNRPVTNPFNTSLLYRRVKSQNWFIEGRPAVQSDAGSDLRNNVKGFLNP